MATARIRYVNPHSSGGDGTTTALSGTNAAYASLQAALDAERGNLVSADEWLEIICATNGNADTVRVNQDVAGWTTDATRYVHIKPDAGHRAGTQWDTGKYRISVPYTSGSTAGQFLICGAAGGPLFVRVEGLQIEATIDSIDSPTRRIMPVVMSPAEAGGGADCRMFGGYVRISGTRALDFTSAESWHGILTNPNTVSPATAPNLYIYNNIVELDVTVTALPSASAAIRGENRRHNLYAYNNTIIGPWVNAFSGSEDSNRLHYLKNNLASGISGNFVSGTYVNTKCDYNATTAAAMGYTAGSNDRVSQTFTFAAPHNFLLLDEDTGAKDHGLVDPGSGLFSTDTTGYTRSGSWDIGAYEYRVLTEPTHLTTNEYGTGYDFGPGPLVSCTNSVDTGSGANRCILVQHMRRSDRAIEIQSVTIGGESMVVLGSDISLIDLYVVRTFALVNPTVEGMQDLVITCTTNDSLSVASTIVAVYDGVDPNASEAALLALADSETVVTPYSSPYTFAVPSQTGHLAMLFAFAGSDDVSYSLTAAGGFNERIRDTAGPFVHRTGDQPGKTSADFTWTPGFLSQNLTIVGHGFSLPPVPADDGFVARLLIRNYLPLLVR